MAKPADGVSYTEPASQVDLKNRLESDFGAGSSTSPLDSKDDSVNPTEQRDLFAVEGNDTDAYVGVSEEYRTYANDTEKPYAFEGVEGDAVKRQFDGQFAVGKTDSVKTESTLGGGSNFETVVTHEAGAGYQPEEVNRKEVYEAAEKEKSSETSDSKTTPTVAKKATASTSSGS